MKEFHKQLRTALDIPLDDRNIMKIWENFVDPKLIELVESGTAIIINSNTKIRTSAPCMGPKDGTMEYVISIIDKTGHPYCLNCGEKDESVWSPTLLIQMFPDQAYSLIEFFHDSRGIAELREKFD